MLYNIFKYVAVFSWHGRVDKCIAAQWRELPGRIQADHRHPEMIMVVLMCGQSVYAGATAARRRRLRRAGVAHRAAQARGAARGGRARRLGRRRQSRPRNLREVQLHMANGLSQTDKKRYYSGHNVYRYRGACARHFLARPHPTAASAHICGGCAHHRWLAPAGAAAARRQAPCGNPGAKTINHLMAPTYPERRDGAANGGARLDVSL